MVQGSYPDKLAGGIADLFLANQSSGSPETDFAGIETSDGGEAGSPQRPARTSYTRKGIRDFRRGEAQGNN